MSEEYESLRFGKKTEPDDFKDHTQEIIWQMRTGYRRHYGIVELPPVPKRPKSPKWYAEILEKALSQVNA